MNNYLFDVFISYPLTEKNEELNKSINTHDFFIAKKINHVLNNLLKIKTFFSDESLLNNDRSDFWEKIKDVLPKSKVLLIILNNKEDYDRTYCREEREIYLKRNETDRKIYFVVSSEVNRHINEFDIMNLEIGKPEVIIWDELEQQEKLYNFLNNYFERNEKGNEREIFYKGNHSGTVCLHHKKEDIRISEDGYLVQFNCCNKVIRLKNKNALINLSPGCVEKVAHSFKK